jgi:hypothetical protein
MNRTQHQCNDPTMRITVRQVGDALSAIVGNMRITIGVCEADLQTQTLKNEFRTNEDRKEPYATTEEIKRMRQELEKTLDSSYTLMKSLDKLCECITCIENVQMKRELRRRHCNHCRGKKGRCHCKAGCKRSDKTACRPSHCEHCSGVDGACGCTQGCERIEGVQCRDRSTFKSTKKASKMKAEPEADTDNDSDKDRDDEDEDNDDSDEDDEDEDKDNLTQILDELQIPKLDKDKSKSKKSSKK